MLAIYEVEIATLTDRGREEVEVPTYYFNITKTT